MLRDSRTGDRSSPLTLTMAFSVVSQKAPFIGDGLFEVGQFLFVAYSRVCTAKGPHIKVKSVTYANLSSPRETANE